MTSYKEKHYRQEYENLVDKAAVEGLSIIEDKINRKGGICRFDGKIFVIFDKNTRLQERSRLISEALQLASENHQPEDSSCADSNM